MANMDSHGGGQKGFRRSNQRESRRINVNLEAMLSFGGQTYPVLIGNLSETGFHIILPMPTGESSAFLEGMTDADVKIRVNSTETIDLSCKKLWSTEIPDSPLVRRVGLLIKSRSDAYKKFYKSLSFQERTEITRQPIAVIGLACYYPGAPNLQQLWENIVTRRRQFRRMPDVRLPLADYYDPDPAAEDKTYGTKAAVIDGFSFDWMKRGIPKSVVDSTDISHWLALDTALKAMEDAGFSAANPPPDRTGVILGNTLTGEQSRAEGMRLRWPFVQKTLRAAAGDTGLSPEMVAALATNMEAYYKSVFAPITEDTLAGGLSNTIAGRICNFLNLNGGGYTVDGACSSSLIAVATAATALLNGNLDLAIVGGVDISLDTFELIGFAKTKALTRDDMRVYDRRANGFIPGEGAGFAVLKKLEDARADGDYIYAVLRGWGMSTDGKGALTAPKAETQALAIRRAYTGAGYGFNDIDFVEGHGTGTPAGDIAELTAIAEVLGDRKTGSLRPCGITSLKSLIGHTKAASGIGGFIKAVMAVNRRVLPPTANCTKPSRTFENTARMVYPIMHGEIRPPREILRAGVSGMGFGGINCHITVESGDAPAANLAPTLEERKLLASSQETELFILGARSPARLLERAQAIRQIAYGMSVGDMVDLAAQLSREVEDQALVRAALIADSPESLSEGLQELESSLFQKPPAAGEKRISPKQNFFIGHSLQKARVGFLFPGQGSQQLNMARLLVERHEWARDFIAKASAWLKEENGIDVIEHIFKPLDRALDQTRIEAWAAELKEAQIAQPAICLAALLWCKKLDRLGITPVAVGGHSLGELTAFHAAGAFDEAALLKLAAMRGQAMTATNGERGVMASLACDYETAAAILGQAKGYVIAANINSPQQLVISGEQAAVEQAVAIARAKGIDTRMLKVSNAFHSRFVTGAAERLQSAAAVPILLNNPRMKLFSGIGGTEMKAGLKLRDHFAEQVISQVDFISIVHAMARECDLLLEVGPAKVLSGFVRTITGDQGPLCLPVESKPGQDRDLHLGLAHLFVQGSEIHWEALYEDRLVRPFVPASARAFIVNPCERPFNLSRPAFSKTVPAESNTLHSTLSAATSIDPQVLSEYLARRGSFLSAMIKSDIENLSMNFQPQGAMAKSASPEVQAPQSINRTGPAAKVEKVQDNDRLSIVDLLLELVEKRTGFPREALSLELRLLDDLNLDSIKSAELIADASMRLGVAGSLDTSRYANKTLAEIAAALDEFIMANGKSTAAEPKVSVKAALPTWVRNFKVTYAKETLSSPETMKDARDLQGEKVLILSRPDESELAEGLGEYFARQGALSEVLGYEESLQKEQLFEKGYTTFIGIQPKTARGFGISKEGFFLAVERLRIIVNLACGAPEKGQPKKVVFIQFGGGFFGRGPKARGVEQCFASALAASLHLERQELKVRVLDFDPLVDAAHVAAKVSVEIATEDHYVASGYDIELTRRVPRLTLQEPAEYKTRGISWSADDVILVTGGAKGITAACALEFARKTGVRMALVGSSPHPESQETGAGSGNEIFQTLSRFKEAGLTGNYYQCDIVDQAAVKNLVRQVQEELGDITGVIHGSALNRPRTLDTVSTDEAFREVSPKVLGAIHLCQALKGQPLKLFIGFSSIIGVSGMARNGWYGFSNEALDLLLRRFADDHPETAVQCMAFSIWDEIGMGIRLGSTKYLAQKGIAAIPVQEGVRRFLELALNDPGEKQVVVTARIAGLDTLQQTPHPMPKTNRFLERIITSVPDVEVVTRAHLTTEKDPYVLDHNWRGTLLFPTVFGLEAMAQAVAYVTGETNFDSISIENIRLERPIPVNPEKGIEIEIRAEVLERQPGEIGRRVRASIGADQTGFSMPHFFATFVLGEERQAPVEKIVLPERPLDIDPKEDLYNGKLLFQGPRFQRLTEIYSLDSNQCVFKSSPTALQDDQGMKSNEKTGRSWVLDDPYFRDSLLHVVQLSVSQHICLPFTIKSIARFAAINDADVPLTGIIRIEGRTDKEVHAVVTVLNDKGRMVERIDGYVLKVLEYHQEYPSPEEIADPGLRDENILRRRAQEIAECWGFTLPGIAAAYLPNLPSWTKEERHELERPIFQRAVRQFQNDAEDSEQEVTVFWLSSGKPYLEKAPNEGWDISLSHDHGTVFCVAGIGPQGCDLQSISKRTRKEWIAILGKDKESLLEELQASGDSLDLAGTRIWVINEALYKAIGSRDLDLKIKKKDGYNILFQAASTPRVKNIVTFPTVLTKGPERIAAFVTHASGTNEETSFAGPHLFHTEKLNFNPALYQLNISDGPQGQPVFNFNFPVTFRETANLSRTIYFSQYFDWIGKLREYIIHPIYQDLVKLFTGGKWGAITNYAEAEIISHAQSGDIIQGRVWLDRISGKEQSTLEFSFEWCKILPGGESDLIATGKTATTWVSVRSHGIVEVQPMPEFARNFFSKLLPPSHREDASHNPSEPIKKADFGNKLYQESAGPLKASSLLQEESIQTSLEDANLIGNIYFANYYKWQGRTRDNFFKKIDPEFYIGEKGGEWRCVHCKVNHINEAMPFDCIVVRMYRKAVYERGVELYFDYFRVNPDGKHQKIGYGEHRAMWYAPNKEGAWKPAELPVPLREALIPKERQVSPVRFIQNKRDREYDVIVIGVGIGGLTAGGLLAKRGKRVLLVDQHNKPGGYCTSWERFVNHNGMRLRFVFDAGVHDIASFGKNRYIPYVLSELMVENDIEWLRTEHEYIINNVWVTVPRDFEEYQKVLITKFPEEKNGLESLLSEIRLCYHELFNKEYSSTSHIMKWKGILFQTMLENYINNKELIQILSILTCYITNNSSAISVYSAIPLFSYYIDGGCYPAGGSQRLPDLLANAIEKFEGKLQLNTAVKKIIIKNSHAIGIKLENGQSLFAENIISNADVRRTFLELVGLENLPQHFSHRIKALKPSNSAFMLFLCVDFLPQIRSITLIKSGEMLVAIMNPSRIDSSLAPTGYASLTIISLCSHEQAITWNRNVPGYKKRKYEYGNKLIAVAERVIPELRTHIIYREEASPATFARYAWTTDGAIYGLAIDEWRPSFKAPLKGLFLAGAGTSMHPGVEHAALSGINVANELSLSR